MLKLSVSQNKQFVPLRFGNTNLLNSIFCICVSRTSIRIYQYFFRKSYNQLFPVAPNYIEKSGGFCFPSGDIGIPDYNTVGQETFMHCQMIRNSSFRNSPHKSCFEYRLSKAIVSSRYCQ